MLHGSTALDHPAEAGIEMELSTREEQVGPAPAPAKEEQPEPARREQPEPPLQSAREEHPGPALLPARGVPEPAPPPTFGQPKVRGRSRSRIPSIIVTLVIAAVACLSIWYLVRPEPLLVQGEVDATRLDIAARVDGRVGDIPVARGQDVRAGAVLVRIDNPETIAKHKQALAAKAVASAQLANIAAGTRPETIAARKAAYQRAQSNVVLAQKTYDRIRQLADHGNASQAQLDQVTDTLRSSQQAADQAKSAYEQAINGYTPEERKIAATNVEKALADIAAVQALVEQMVIYAPVASQVYKRNVEPGEFVSPGVPLVTLIDLSDTWIHFDLREDLVRTLKIGDRFVVRIPALDDRSIPVEVRLIATKGEYASWRATRATGDFDLRTFEIRAYPVDRIKELRPGMSAYVDWQAPR